MDLETLRIEYESAQASLTAQRKVYQGYERAAQEAQNALVDAIIAAGLTEYGPITSRSEWHAPSETFRRVWSNEEDYGRAQ